MSNLTPVSRVDRDVLDLIMKGYEVKFSGNSSIDKETVIIVKFYGPIGSIYEGGGWKVQVVLTEDYPFKYPYISFINKIFHPNIGFLTGYITLRDLDEKWTSTCNLRTIFEEFLPNLLDGAFCNPAFVLNQEAAALYMMNMDTYEAAVKKHVLESASGEVINELDVVGLNDEDDSDALSLGSSTSTMTVPSWAGDFQTEEIDWSETELGEESNNSEESMEFENQQEEMPLQVMESRSYVQIIEKRLTNLEEENDNDLLYEPPLKRRKYQ